MIVFKEVLDDQDVMAVEGLAREIWREHFTPIIGAAQVVYMLKELQSFAAIKRWLDQGYKYYLVDVNGMSAGYLGVLAKPEEGALFLSKIYLLSSLRGKGIGQRMMSFVEELARKDGLKKIFLNTNKKNLDTIRFYEKAGFVKHCSDVVDLGNGFVADDWRMEKAV